MRCVEKDKLDKYLNRIILDHVVKRHNVILTHFYIIIVIYLFNRMVLFGTATKQLSVKLGMKELWSV